MAYRAPLPPPLPSFRVTEAPAFTYVGLDFAGPLYVKQSPSRTEGSKVWICLYTCCVTRGVHLDLVTDLTTSAFMRSFKRFVARRGIPDGIVSDNGKTFKAAAKVLSDDVAEDIRLHLLPMRVKWLFNVERAPWWGGVFERMVQSTKRCLRKIVAKASLSYEELLTVITEVEMIINCRPLSFVSQNDLDQPLTPSHLINGRRIMSLPVEFAGNDVDEIKDPEFDVSRSILTKRMRSLERLIDSFWKRWKFEYLLELRTHHQYKRRLKGHQVIAEGDVVIVHDEKERRQFWKLGLVIETLPGRDGEVRAAVIKVCPRGGTCKLLRRPVQHLYPLEVNDSPGQAEVTVAQKDIAQKPVNEATVPESIEDDRIEVTFNEEDADGFSVPLQRGCNFDREDLSIYQQPLTADQEDSPVCQQPSTTHQEDCPRPSRRAARIAQTKIATQVPFI